MAIPRAYVDEACPLDGYGDLSVRVCASVTDREWRRWGDGNLGAVGCEACAALRTDQAADAPRAYCEACTAARLAFGQSIVLFYGPRLLEHDVATPEQALALFDDDDTFASEIVTWLYITPRAVRERRISSLIPN